MKNKFSFWKPVKVKPLFSFNKPKSPVKLIQYPSRTKSEWKLIDRKPWSDSDRDRVPNIFDCKPLNKRKQSYMFRKEIEQNVISPERIIKTPSGKTMHVNFPTKQELEADIKSSGLEGRDVPSRRRILTKKDIIRQIQKNPEFYTTLKKQGVNVEMKNSWDAVNAEIPEHEGGGKRKFGQTNRSLANYRPAYRTIQVNPIRDIKDPTLLTSLKHEIVHVGQDMREGPGTGNWRLHEQEREAYKKMHEPTAREVAKAAGPKPEALKTLSERYKTDEE